METSNCPICASPSAQVKCLLFSIKKRLKSLLNEYVPDFSQEDTKDSKNNLKFIHMLKIVFGDKYFSHPMINKCQHQKICRYLKRKFKCDSKTFLQLCDQLSLKTGQKNFHFQVLTSQIRTLSETSIKMFQRGEKQGKPGIKTKQSIQPIPQMRINEWNGIENMENQNYNYRNVNQQINSTQNMHFPYFLPLSFFYTAFPSNPNNPGG